MLYRTGKSCLHPELGQTLFWKLMPLETSATNATQRHESHGAGMVHALQGSSGGKAVGFSDFRVRHSFGDLEQKAHQKALEVMGKLFHVASGCQELP